MVGAATRGASGPDVAERMLLLALLERRLAVLAADPVLVAIGFAGVEPQPLNEGWACRSGPG